MRALAKLLRSADTEPPGRDRLHGFTLAGDLVSNAMYYSTVAASSAGETWARGVILGLVAGLGAVVLPEKLGLGTSPHSGSVRNQVMTVAWYLIGGLAAAAAANAMRRDADEEADSLVWTPETPDVPGMSGLGF